MAAALFLRNKESPVIWLVATFLYTDAAFALLTELKNKRVDFTTVKFLPTASKNWISLVSIQAQKMDAKEEALGASASRKKARKWHN